MVKNGTFVGFRGELSPPPHWIRSWCVVVTRNFYLVYCCSVGKRCVWL